MIHAAETCRKMVEKSQDLKDVADPEHHNQFVRMVMVKEEHAKKCKEQLYILWSDYFKPEHLTKYPDLHTKFWMAAKQCGKVKQTLSIEECDKLLDQVQDIAEIFADSKI
jgi:nickel superoxide dismutase